MAVQDRKSQVGAEELSVNVEVYQTSFELLEEVHWTYNSKSTPTGLATKLP